MTHKYADVIKAWLDGKEVQLRWRPDEPWQKYPREGWQPGTMPIFDEAYDFRIKPESVNVVPYKRYVYRNCNGRLGVDCTWLGDDALTTEVEGGTFVKWIDTEWQEYVVNGD